MALEFQSDFDAFLDSTTGHGVTATFFEVQQSLWDDRVGNIDSWFDIDSGNSAIVDIIMDQEFFQISGESVDVEGYQPTAIAKFKDIPYISHDDKLIVNAITTRQGSTLVPETTYLVKNVQNSHDGMVKLILEKQ